MRGLIFNVQRYCVHDGPGIRTTVFLKGCPLRCFWCHNPEGRSFERELSFIPGRCVGCGGCLKVCPNPPVVRGDGGLSLDRSRCRRCFSCARVCPSGALEVVGRFVEAEELLEELQRDRPFFEESGGGITFSGGEPLSQPDFLLSSLEGARRLGLSAAVDTSGFAPRDVVLEASRLADLFLFDLKDADEARHLRNTGVPLEPILENLRLLDELGARIWIRIPVIPGQNDDPETVEAFLRLLSDLRGRRPVFLLPFHRVGQDKWGRIGGVSPCPPMEPPSRERMEGLALRFRARGFQVKVGG